ncbi:MAG TPA: metallophosphoesterase, partial [Bacteroidales bacterium]|nr:metallophosphoesterase [Bacteroidales bacterium]
MAMKILATSDLHLGKRSSEVPLTEKESSTRYTWEQIVDGCLNQAVDVVLLAGDIVDRDNRFFEAVGPLQAGLEKLDRAGITVIITAGNHDYDVLPAITGNNS